MWREGGEGGGEWKAKEEYEEINSNKDEVSVSLSPSSLSLEDGRKMRDQLRSDYQSDCKAIALFSV